MHAPGTMSPKGGWVLMSPRSQWKYLAANVQRYCASPYPIKTASQSAFYSACGHHRKYALRSPRGFKHFALSVNPSEDFEKIY